MKRHKIWLVAGVVLAGALASGTARAGLTDRIAELMRQQAEKEKQKQDAAAAATAGRTDPLQGMDPATASSLDQALTSKAGSYRPRDGATKVVPVLAVGQAKPVGVAQVYGPEKMVESVQAVVGVDVALNDKKLQGRVLIPIDSRDLSRSFHRINQVGVAAVLDAK